jgi:hypothetical protein
LNYVTDYHKSLIGTEGPVISAPTPVSFDSIRRFAQAAMIEDSIHWDADDAAVQGFSAVVAPPLYPMHAITRAAGTPDPFDTLTTNPDWDGVGDPAPQGLPALNLPLYRILNGGMSAEFFKLAEVGDLISSQARYVEIRDRNGRSGDFVTVTIETDYKNQRGEMLVRTRSTVVYR